MRSQWKSSAPIQIRLETVAFDYLRSRIRQISVSSIFQLQSETPPLLQINACPHKDEIKRNNCSVQVLLGYWNLGLHEQMLGQLKLGIPEEVVAQYHLFKLKCLVGH